MFDDDILEGWLDVPGMHTMLQPQASSVDNAYASVSTSSGSQDIAWSAGSGSDSCKGHVAPDSASPLTILSPGAQRSSPSDSQAPRKRKGHTKSRLGCLGCKRRKVKCLEQWPACSGCTKRGVPCVYPTVFKYSQHERLVAEALKSPLKLKAPSNTSPVYSEIDMRLFHHYLIAAYPSIPLAYDSVWTKDIPTFSHQYKYLMHGILALSASHLSLSTETVDDAVGLFHRQKAITGLEEAFGRWPPNAEEAHVMLATSYLLTFQSLYVPDGLLDHFISLRGCAFVSQLIFRHQLHGAFSAPIDLTAMSEKANPVNFPAFDQPLARGLLHALASFQSLLDAPGAHGIHRAFYAQLVGAARALVAPVNESLSAVKQDLKLQDFMASYESWSGVSISTEDSGEFKRPVTNPMIPGELATTYQEIMSKGPEALEEFGPDHHIDPLRAINCLLSTLLILATWPQEEVLQLFSSTNKLGRLLTAYFCCMRFLVEPLCGPESAMRSPISAVVSWCENLVNAIRDDEDVKWSQHAEFPRRILCSLRACIDKNRALSFRDVYKALLADPSAFVEGRAPIM